MDTVITKFDENSLQIENDPIVQVQTISLEEIESQLAHCLASRATLDSHITYYENLKKEALNFALKSKEEIEAAKPIEEVEVTSEGIL